MQNISDENCRENQTRILCAIYFFLENLAICDVLFKKFGTARQVTDEHLIRRRPIACWIPKATNTHSEYIILIDFPLQQSLHERSSMLCYTYTACLLISVIITSIFHTYIT
jgi:hypothetical protein